MKEKLIKLWTDMADRLAGSSVGRFWRWWIGELAGVVPANWREALSPPTPQVVFKASDDGRQFLVYSGAGEVFEFALDDDASVVHRNLESELQQQSLDNPEYVLAMDASQVLRKTVDMPNLPERELRQAIVYDVDRQTPFPAADIYFDCLPAPAPDAAGQRPVDLFVGLRKQIDPLIQSLEGFGFKPHRLDLVAADDAVPGMVHDTAGAPALSGLNLLPRERRSHRANHRARLNWLLGAVVVALLAAVMAQSLIMRERHIEELEAEVAELGIEARKVANMRDQINQAVETAQFLTQRKTRHPPAIEVINEVTRIIPDDTYIERFTLKEGEIQLRGQSVGAQKLITEVNASPLLFDAAFEGPISVDPRSSRERFTLSIAMNDNEAEDATAAIE